MWTPGPMAPAASTAPAGRSTRRNSLPSATARPRAPRTSSSPRRPSAAADGPPSHSGSRARFQRLPPSSVKLLAESLPGPYEVVELDRSFHVATIDYDRDMISERAVAFARQHAS